MGRIMGGGFLPMFRRGLTPASLSDVEQWLKADADALEQSGGSISSDGGDCGWWGDQSGNGNHATQATAAQKPHWIADQVNGLPLLKFDGVDDLLIVDSMATHLSGDDGPAFTLFMVAQKVSNNTYDILYGGSRSDSIRALRHLRTDDDDTYHWRHRDNLNNSADATGGSSDTDGHLLTFTFTGTAASLYRDGVAIFEDQASDVGNVTINQATIGASQERDTSAEANYADVYVGEIVFVSRVVTNAERGQMETYFGNRWGPFPF